MFRTARCLMMFSLALSVLSACSPHHFRYQQDPEIAGLLQQTADYPQTSFLVFSDPHVFHPDLGAGGIAFEEMMKKDRKMLPLSVEILSTAVERMASKPADFVIVCGDLTKDGELENHRRFKQLMAPLVRSGKQVFVVPGNHDVANGHAFRYRGATREEVPSIDDGQFAEMYHEFGYGLALYRDTDSLSYLAEPVPGLWLLALDSCRWKENRPGHHPVTGGSLSPGTLAWIEECLIRAKKQNKAVIACMHHGLLEHYEGNADHYPDYLVANHRQLAPLLASYSVRLLFSGHFHTQDISLQRLPDTDRFIFDIETGSLVTYPCPYRRVSIDAGQQQAHIQSYRIDAIPSYPTGFSSHARDFLFQSTVQLAEATLAGYAVSPRDRKLIAPLIAEAMTIHTEGDEPGPEIVTTGEGAEPGAWGSLILWAKGGLLSAWQRDLPPGDNHLTIDLSRGQYTPPARD